MSKLITETKLQEIISRIEEKLVSAKEEPLTDEKVFGLLGYKTLRTFKNNRGKYPHHIDPVSKRFFYYLSEINPFIKGKAA